MRRRAAWLASLWCLAAALGVLVLMTGGSGSRRANTGSRKVSESARNGGSAVAPAPAPTPRPRAAVLFGRGGERASGGNGTVVGRALDLATGRPLAKADVAVVGTSLAGAEVRRTAVTARDGAFAVSDVPVGDGYALRVSLLARSGAVASLDVSDGGVTDVGTVWIGEPTALDGRVEDGRGRGVAGATVAVHRGAGAAQRVADDFAGSLAALDREETAAARATTDGAGRFRVDAIEPGPVTLVARADGFALGVVAAVAAPRPEGAPGVRIVLDRGEAVSGRVVTEDGAPVAGARVAVTTGEDPESFLYGRAFAETGPDGSFRATALPSAGDLTAVVAAAGYPTTFAWVRAGERNAEIVLRRVAPLDVRVLGSDGSGVAGAQVVLAVGERPTAEEQPATIVSGTTDAEGRVVLEARAGALQQAMVTHPERGSALWTPDAPSGAPGLLRGPDDPAIPPGGRSLVLTLRDAVVVTGRVTSATSGEAVVGARVAAVGPLGLLPASLTDADGRYRVVAPAAAGSGPPALVVVRVAGFAQDPRSMAIATAPTEPGRYLHDVRLFPAGAVAGQVSDAAGRPVMGASVTVVDGGAHPMERRLTSALGRSRAFTGPDGRYRLEGVGAMRAAVVVADVAGFPSASSSPFPVGPGATARAPVVVVRTGAALEVRVLSPDGAPVAGARVAVHVEAEAKAALDAFAAARRDAFAEADERGVARLDGLPAGKAEVAARAAGFAEGTRAFEIPKEAAAVPSVEVRLAPALVLAGRVVDAAGRPLPAAQVRVLRASADEGDDAALLAATDEAGAFRFDDAPDERLELVVRHRNHAESRQSLERPRPDVEVRLQPENPEVVRRREEIRAELGRLAERMQSAASEEARAALRARVEELVRALGR